MLQDGAYRRLMDEYYVQEKPLTLDRSLLYARVRANTQEERWAVDSMLSEFFVETPKGFTNKKAEEELRFANSRAKTARNNGLAGGRPKTQRDTSGLAKDCAPSKTPQTPDSRLQTEEETSKTFHPPTQAEVCAFMQSRKIPDAEQQAELFYAHHANRKWHLGGGKGPVMVSWRKAVVTWQANIQKFSGGGNGARSASGTGGATKLDRFEQAAKNVTGRGSGLAEALRGNAVDGRAEDQLGRNHPVLQRLAGPAPQPNGTTPSIPVVPGPHRVPAPAEADSRSVRSGSGKDGGAGDAKKGAA